MIASIAASGYKTDIVPKFHMTRGLGFPFTPEDNYRMHLVCRAAERFMQTYGQAQ